MRTNVMIKPTMPTVKLVPVVLLCVATSIVLSQSGGGRETIDELCVRKLILVDDKGNENGVLTESGLTIWNKERTISATFGFDHSAMPLLGFKHEEAPMPEIAIGMRNGDPVFTMRTRKGERRIGMAVTKTGSAGIGLYYKPHDSRCAFTIDEHGSSEIEMVDKRGTKRFHVMLQLEGFCAMNLMDQQGRLRAAFGLDEDGDPLAATLGPEGKVLWKSSSDTSASSLEGL